MTSAGELSMLNLMMFRRTFKILGKHHRIGLDYQMEIADKYRFEATDTPETHKEANILAIELLQFFDLRISPREWHFENVPLVW